MPLSDAPPHTTASITPNDTTPHNQNTTNFPPCPYPTTFNPLSSPSTSFATLSPTTSRYLSPLSETSPNTTPQLLIWYTNSSDTSPSWSPRCRPTPPYNKPSCTTCTTSSPRHTPRQKHTSSILHSRYRQPHSIPCQAYHPAPAPPRDVSPSTLCDEVEQQAFSRLGPCAAHKFQVIPTTDTKDSILNRKLSHAFNNDNTRYHNCPHPRCGHPCPHSVPSLAAKPLQRLPTSVH